MFSWVVDLHLCGTTEQPLAKPLRTCLSIKERVEKVKEFLVALVDKENPSQTGNRGIIIVRSMANNRSQIKATVQKNTIETR